ncbi:Pol polyprotein [Elysia marginata]|uniref:Pol polyprotein n=1 Tax=Elysia marginata TaxID=1093978 RepID=A0AAV4FE38_9GAST|nr:Pol polyprotein [Elysia marginata]
MTIVSGLFYSVSKKLVLPSTRNAHSPNPLFVSLDKSSMGKVSTLTLKRLREFESFQLQATLLSSNDFLSVRSRHRTNRGIFCYGTTESKENLPASSAKLQEIIADQRADPELAEVRSYCQKGWPAFMPQNPLLHQYWASQRHLTMIVDDLLLHNDRIVIPRDMRLEMLNKLHESQFGIPKCRALAQTSVWWPNVSSQIEDMVKKCSVCTKLKPATKEPLMAASFPDRPWSRVAMDLFDLHGKTYLLVVDYHSRWPEIRLLDSLTSAAVIIRLKSIFCYSRHTRPCRV